MTPQGPLPSCTVRYPVTKTLPGQGFFLDQKMSTRLGCVSQQPPVPVRPSLQFYCTQIPRFLVRKRLNRDQRLPVSRVGPASCPAVSRDSLPSAGVKGVYHLTWPYFGFETCSLWEPGSPHWVGTALCVSTSSVLGLIINSPGSSWMSEIKLWPSCFYDKHLADWTTSPGPFSDC